MLFAGKSKPFVDPNNPGNFTTPSERLENRTKFRSSAYDQVQNYERTVFNKKENLNNINLEKDLSSILDEVDSTNKEYLQNQNHPDQKGIKYIEMSYADFLRESDNFILRLRSAFKDIITQDRNVSLEYNKTDPYNLSFKVHVKNQGTYVIAKELETRLLTVTSPLSGFFKYNYDPQRKYWISIRDGHILEELLMREFCQHSKGLLIIDK
jgi:frataxin-like iron-binding protein CyaY